MNYRIFINLTLVSALTLFPIARSIAQPLGFEHVIVLSGSSEFDALDDQLIQINVDQYGEFIVYWQEIDGYDQRVLMIESTDEMTKWSDVRVFSDWIQNSSIRPPSLAYDGIEHWIYTTTSETSRIGVIPPFGYPNIYYYQSDFKSFVLDENGDIESSSTQLLDINLGNSRSPSFAKNAVNGNLIGITAFRFSVSDGTYALTIKRSLDNGQTWESGMTQLVPNPRGNILPVHVISGGGDNWVIISEVVSAIVYPQYKFSVFYTHSTDNGVTWSPVVPLKENSGINDISDRFPEVASAGNGVWITVWQSSDHLNDTVGSDNDILIARSFDNGTTWTQAVPLNTNAFNDSIDDEKPSIATDGKGNWVVVWHAKVSPEATDTDIMIALSRDNGATWTDPAPLNSNHATDTGYDLDPKIAVNDAGVWLVVWRSNENLNGVIGDDFDLFYTTSRGLIAETGLADWPLYK